MSYQVLARKWRPQNFSQMVGQEHVLRALSNALDSGRVHHAFLFTGTRGVGKTTLARILAKSLNCETGISSTPCGECSTCQEINAGRFVDLIEVDAASRTKVEDTRELLDNVQYAPTRGRYKVYLIDEVHMLSNHSFNALLKTLEEPPPHVKFLLATTDPQKLPVTILSRCLQFNLRRMHPQLIIQHLQYILGAEQIAFEMPALKRLARAADGSMRDALSLLDQAIAYASGNVNDDDVRAMLGDIEHTYIFDLLQALASKDSAAVIRVLQGLSEKAPDYNEILAELLVQLHHLALLQQVPEAYDESMGDQMRLLQLASSLSAEDIQLFYQIGLNGRRDLPMAPDRYLGLEMILLRMLAFAPVSSAQQLAAAAEPTPAATQNTPPQQQPSAAAATTAPQQQPSTAAATTAPQQQPSAAAATTAPQQQPSAAAATTVPQQQPSAAAAITAPRGSAETQQMQTETTPARAVTTQASAPASLSSTLRSDDEWYCIVERLGLTAMLNQLAMNCVMPRYAGNEMVLHLQSSCENLLTAERRDRLQELLREQLGKPISLKIEVADSQQETPAQIQQRLQQQRLAEAKNSIESDANVQNMMETFGAQINQDSIQPID